MIPGEPTWIEPPRPEDAHEKRFGAVARPATRAPSLRRAATRSASEAVAAEGRRWAPSRRVCRSVLAPDDGGWGVIDRTTLYVTSDGRYLTGWQLHRRVVAGEWTTQLTDRSGGTMLVETDGGSVIGLTRLRPSDRPNWLELRSDGTGVWVADRRRTLPPSRSGRCVIEPPIRPVEPREPLQRS